MIKEFGHIIRGRFHEVEALGTETVHLLHVFLFPMHSSASLGPQFDTPLCTDSPFPFSCNESNTGIYIYNNIKLLYGTVRILTFTRLSSGLVL